MASSIRMIDRGEALRGRATPIQVNPVHAVLGTSTVPPFPESMHSVILGMGCFWGAERVFWNLEGVYSTQVGYSGGFTPNPSYEEVCSGNTGHTEVVRVVFDPDKISLDKVLKSFWEEHDPTTAMRQGNDIGTQYRSALYLYSDQDLATAQASKQQYEAALKNIGKGPIVTEIVRAGAFYYAENYHQQYLHKVPHGYCGLQGTGAVLDSSAVDSQNS